MFMVQSCLLLRGGQETNPVLALLKMAIKTVSFPIKNGDFP